jgi:hypothetical protein
MCTTELTTTMVCETQIPATDTLSVSYTSHATHLTPHAPLASTTIHNPRCSRRLCSTDCSGRVVGRAPRQPMQVSGVRDGDSEGILTAVGRKASLFAIEMVSLLVPGGAWDGENGDAGITEKSERVVPRRRFMRWGGATSGGSSVCFSESEIDGWRVESCTRPVFFSGSRSPAV